MKIPRAGIAEFHVFRCRTVAPSPRSEHRKIYRLFRITCDPPVVPGESRGGLAASKETRPWLDGRSCASQKIIEIRLARVRCRLHNSELCGRLAQMALRRGQSDRTRRQVPKQGGSCGWAFFFPCWLASLLVAFWPTKMQLRGQSLPKARALLAAPRVRSSRRIFSELLALKPGQLGGVDIALMNMLCAERLPGADDLRIQPCFRTCSISGREWVESETKRHLYRFPAQPRRVQTCRGLFPGSDAHHRVAAGFQGPLQSRSNRLS